MGGLSALVACDFVAAGKLPLAPDWVLRQSLVLFLAAVTSFAVSMTQAVSAEASSEESLIAKAKAIHEQVLTLDTHADIAGPESATEKLDAGINHPQLKCDLVKMAQGGVDAVFLVVLPKIGDKVRQYNCRTNLPEDGAPPNHAR